MKPAPTKPMPRGRLGRSAKLVSSRFEIVRGFWLPGLSIASAAARSDRNCGVFGREKEKVVRVGIFVSETWGAGSPIGEVRERAQRAEALGFASGWVPYLPWSLDAFAAIQAAGEATKEILLGTAVVPTYFFHPLAMARQAATVQAAIGRPIELGVGCSNVAVIAMHGLPYERPARHMREYVEILSSALALGERPMGAREKAGFVQYSGDFFELGSIYGAPDTRRPGRLLVGALGPQMLRVAGAFTDGTIATWADAGAIERGIVPGLMRAASEAGQALADGRRCRRRHDHERARRRAGVRADRVRLLRRCDALPAHARGRKREADQRRLRDRRRGDRRPAAARVRGRGDDGFSRSAARPWSVELGLHGGEAGGLDPLGAAHRSVYRRRRGPTIATSPSAPPTSSAPSPGSGTSVGSHASPI